MFWGDFASAGAGIADVLIGAACVVLWPAIAISMDRMPNAYEISFITPEVFRFGRWRQCER